MVLVVNLLLVIISIFLLVLLSKKLTLPPQSLNIIVFTTLFWVVIKLIRSFRSIYAKEVLSNQDLIIGGLNLGLATVSIAGIYGLISIFVRFPFGLLYGKMKNQFNLIRLVTLTLVISSFLVGFINSNHQGYGFFMWFSALAMGLGASVWGLLNVTLNSQMRKGTLVAISTLSITPLFAEYLAAPFQFIAKNYLGWAFLWQMSFVFALITFVYSFFIKNLNTSYHISKKGLILITKDWHFWIISTMGVMVILLKFATTGNVATFYISTLTNDAFLISYIDLVFSLFQLLSGVYLGIKLTHYFSNSMILVIGLLMFLSFTLINGLVVNPWIFFITYSLHGIGYGICYNLLMGMLLQRYKQINHPALMGLYQSLLAVGIYFGSTLGIKKIIQNDFSGFLKIISLLIAIIVIIIVILTPNNLKKGKENEV